VIASTYQPSQSQTHTGCTGTWSSEPWTSPHLCSSWFSQSGHPSSLQWGGSL